MKIRKSLLLPFFCMMYIITFAQTRYEAEDATLADGAVAVSLSSASGGAYVQLQSGTITFTIDVTEDTYFNMYLYVASPNGEKTNYFVVNGNSASFSLENNSSYITQQVASFAKLSAGSNTVAIEPSWGWINVDYLEIEEVDASTRFDIAEDLCTPNATDQAKGLYCFLKDNYGEKIISGVMTLDSNDESDWLYENTGKEPALLGIDFMQCDQGYSWYDDNIPRDDALNWYNKNGIPAMCWHWRDPSTTGGDFYTSGTDFDVTAIFDSTSSDYAAMISDIDFVAEQFLYLQEQGVAVIWRPLHEASGGWFWWGAQGADACKELWHVMWDRLVNYHGVRNLIWVWTYQSDEDESWYPGDDYVDIIGMDIYKDEDHSSQIMEFNNVNDVFGGNKLITESECGSFPDPDSLEADGAAWSWFMPWYGDFVEDGVYNTLDFWKKTMEHEYVITLDEMPDLSTYACSATGTDATLSDITADIGEFTETFSSDVYTYTLEVAEGADIPEISATATDTTATVTVDQPDNVPGTATITVLAADLTTKLTYTVNIVIAEQSQSITLKQGWNLVSVYVNPNDPSIETVLSCADVVKNQDEYYLASNIAGLNLLTEVVMGDGYLVYASSECSVTVQGTTSTGNSTQFKQGWNLLGVPTDETTSISDAITEIVDYIEIIKDFNGFWENGGSTNSITDFEPGKAYFIKVTQDCSLEW